MKRVVFTLSDQDYNRILRDSSVSGWPMREYLERHLAVLLKLVVSPQVHIIDYVVEEGRNAPTVTSTL